MNATQDDLDKLPTETILAEIGKLQNSIKHLVRSNTEMKEFDPELTDGDLHQAVQENEQVIARQDSQIDRLIETIRNRLGADAAREIESTVQEYRQKDLDLISGRAADAVTTHSADTTQDADAAADGNDQDTDGVFL
ncbi:hypothetical protein INT43_008320 [Umbelopsis isabellina]|uniref:Uncharacterized protein n=1 Tax=Mortierella isabellina TaxID=91625 RepID=A0A8H7U9L8_MORIS|nr:hypothetical protein INT43_008320 [Umbelopsis isabellina]